MPTANAQIPGTQNFWFVAEEVSTSIPTGMTITNADQNKLVVSIYDDDYEPAPSPLPPATLLSLVADGSTETLIDIQGVIGTLGSDDELTVTLNYTATASVDYPAFSETVSVPSELIEGGDGPIDLTLSYPAGTTVVGDGTITATIAAASTLNVKKLDLYGAGFNDPIIGYPLAAFSLSTDDSGGAGTVGVRIMTGIPDRKFGVAVNDVDNTAHNFIYTPVVSNVTGRTWLQQNLGADYTRLSSPNFNPVATPTSPYNDNLAAGSMFQFGRAADGHELMNADRTPVISNTTTTKSNSPNHSNYITASANPYSWTSSINATTLNYWNGVNAVNNPCPQGYRVPTIQDWLDEADGWAATTTAYYDDSNLVITPRGSRHWTGYVTDSNKFLHTSGNSSAEAITHGSGEGFYPQQRRVELGGSVPMVMGFPVRCIKD